MPVRHNCRVRCERNILEEDRYYLRDIFYLRVKKKEILFPDSRRILGYREYITRV